VYTIAPASEHTGFTSAVAVKVLVLGLPVMVGGGLVGLMLAFGAAMVGLIVGVLGALGASGSADASGTLQFGLLVAVAVGQLGCGGCAFVSGFGLIQRQAWARSLIIAVLVVEIALAFAWLALQASSGRGNGMPASPALDALGIGLGQLVWIASFVLLCAATIAGFLSARVRREFGLS
jgi:hypothetical protein